MRPPTKMSRIIGGLRYSVETATLVASNAYWDGHNFERHGRNTFLYRTPRGNFFRVDLTQWQGEKDCLDPISLDEAVELYEGPLSEHELGYEEAFPHIKVEEA